MEEELLNGKTLLVVDDEVDLRDIMASEMEFMGARVFQAGNVTSAKEVLKHNSVDLIVSDIRMPGGTGIDLLDFVKAQDPNQPPVILITGFADITLEDAFNKGAEALLSKPFKLDDLIKVAAKNTLPVEERFKDVEAKSNSSLELVFSESIHEAMAHRSFLLGRGGMTLTMSTQRKKIEVGEVLNFSIGFEDRTLKGVAVCRWVKLQESGRVALGFEFLHIDEPTLDFCTEHWRKKTPGAYIPLLS